MTTTQITPGAIVAAVDGSDHAITAVQWAAAQARIEGRPLVLVHVISRAEVLPSTLRTVEHGEEVAWADAGAHASEFVLETATEAAQAVAPEVPVHGVSVPGEPRRALADLSGPAHLLVLGSRGRGAVRSRLLGSVSAHVAKTTRCPMVVIRPETHRRLKDGVIVAADATAESRPVVEFAFRLASLHDLPLTILHCLYDVPATATGRAGGYVRTLPDADERSRLLTESIAGVAEKYPDVHVTRELMQGTVADCLAAHPRPWNLVVVGRHPVHGLDWLTGSTAVDVMEHSASPIAVVPEPEHVPTS